MKNLRFRLTLLGGALLMLAFTSVASAQASRTWVSGVGDDANPCSRTAPCKTFAGAISKTAPGGEIDCLDPGGFGAVTITKAISIDCDGTFGSVLVSGTPGIVVAAGAGDTVRIRGLSVQGIGSGTNGIRFLSGAALDLNEVFVQNFTNNCLDIALTSNSGVVTVQDSDFKNCGSADTTGGVVVNNGGSFIAKVDLNNVRIARVINGVLGNNGARIAVTNSVISETTNAVRQAAPSPAAGSTILVTNSVISNNSVGMQSITGCFMGASGNTFYSNFTIIFNTNGGSIVTAGDNPSFGNTGTGGTSGALPKV